MRHYFQAQALKSIILDGKIPAGIKQDVADSMSYGLIAQNNLSDLLKLTHIAKNRDFNSDVVKEFLKTSKDPNFYLNLVFNDNKNKYIASLDQKMAGTPKGFIDYYAYLQLQYEEDARMAGANFAEDFLNQILYDENYPPPPRIKNYIEQSIVNVQDSQSKEYQRRSNKVYQIMRTLYNKAIEKAITTNERDIEKIFQNISIPPILKNQIKEFRLYNMRKNNIDKASYYKAVLTYKGKNALSQDKASCYYMMNSDPKEIMFSLLKKIDKSSTLKDILSAKDALGNVNFLNPATPIYFSPKELVNLCFEWLKQEKYMDAYNIFCLNFKNTSIVAPGLTEERFYKIRKAIRNNNDIYYYLDGKLSVVTNILNKKVENISIEEYAFLNEILYDENLYNENLFQDNSNNISVDCAKALNLNVSEYLNLLDDLRIMLEMSDKLDLDLPVFDDIRNKIKEVNSLKGLKESALENKEKERIFDFIYNPSATEFIAKSICENKNYTLQDIDEYLKRLESGKGLEEGKYKSLHSEMKIGQLIYSSDIEKDEASSKSKNYKFTKFLNATEVVEIIKKAMDEEGVTIKQFDEYLDLVFAQDSTSPKYEKFDHSLRRAFALSNIKSYIEKSVNDSKEI